mmetsp:Transcript_14167/g.41155  ORF Transcript_14167/g.41155 Transcript_14167/m.41155 type:complete len:206 (+) Transcript_14167:1302-1919(+)
MRPQLGSPPKIALLASDEPVTDRATCRASASVFAPTAWTSMRHVAPSPSHAMLFARPCSSAVRAPSSFLPSALPASVTVAFPASPLARPMTQSLVLVSPSTVIWLKLATDARLTMPCHTSASTLASHVTTPSMVAMLGWIMPDPLHMPPRLTSLPPSVICGAGRRGRRARTCGRVVAVGARAACTRECSAYAHCRGCGGNERRGG